MLWKTPCRNHSSNKVWASGALCKACLDAAAPGRWDTGDPETMGLAPPVSRVTTQAGSLKNTVASIFIYQKRRVLEIICLFFESTHFPKETANFFPQLWGSRLNIFHTNFFPQQMVQLLQQLNLPFLVTSTAHVKRELLCGTNHIPERGKPLNPSTVSFKWGGTN